MSGLDTGVANRILGEIGLGICKLHAGNAALETPPKVSNRPHDRKRETPPATNEPMTEPVRYEVTAGVATVTLDRPETYNAITPALLDRLNDALREARDDDAVYAIVLAGAGDGFCSGVDTDEVGRWVDQSREEYAAFLRSYQHCVRQLRASDVPTIAAVDGPAVGGGCGLALGCDLRFVSELGYLRPNFTRLGIVPVDGTAWILAREIGPSRARQYLLPGDDIDAATLVELGLAVECVEDPTGAARQFAADLVDRPARAVRDTNDLVGFAGDLDAYFTAGIERQWACIGDPEHAEAVAAMREGRDPAYDRPT